MPDQPEPPKVGTTQQIQVITRPDRPYLIADNSIVVHVVGPSQYVELIAITVQNRYSAQTFSVVQGSGDEIGLMAGQFEGGMVLEDQGAMRFTVQGAEAAAIGIFKHLIQTGGVDRQEMMARLEEALNG